MNWHQLFSNQFFSGGIALGLIAALAAFSRHYVALLFDFARGRYVAEIEVRDEDMVRWLGVWLSSTPYGQRCRRLSTYVLYQGGGLITQGDEAPALLLEPGIGPHVFRHDGTVIILDRRREDATPGRSERKEWYLLRVIGSRERAAEILEDAKVYARALLSRRHTAFLSDGRGGWDEVGVGLPREISSVVLPGSTVEDAAEREDQVIPVAPDLVRRARHTVAARVWFIWAASRRQNVACARRSAPPRTAALRARHHL